MQQTNIGKKIVGAVAAVIAAIVVLFLSFSAFEDTDRSKNYVCQFPVSGNYEVWTDGGTQWQGFGNVKEYNKTSFLFVCLMLFTAIIRLKFRQNCKVNLNIQFFAKS